ncbi:MAG TPA: hypothetical protein VJZ27_14215, partial [Aggregatilineales bacterium]|nr:hypothetical protein [Aggregatilineales bacterium]
MKTHYGVFTARSDTSHTADVLSTPAASTEIYTADFAWAVLLFTPTGSVTSRIMVIQTMSFTTPATTAGALTLRTLKPSPSRKILTCATLFRFEKMIHYYTNFDTSGDDTLLIVLWFAVCLLGIVLKLTGALSVSWAIILMPLWLPVVVVAFIFIILIFSVIQF